MQSSIEKALPFQGPAIDEGGMTLGCTWEQFKRVARDFHFNAPTLELAELDNAWKCLALHYLGMHEAQWNLSAEILFRREALWFLEQEQRLLSNPKA